MSSYHSHRIRCEYMYISKYITWGILAFYFEKNTLIIYYHNHKWLSCTMISFYSVYQHILIVYIEIYSSILTDNIILTQFCKVYNTNKHIHDLWHYDDIILVYHHDKVPKAPGTTSLSQRSASGAACGSCWKKWTKRWRSIRHWDEQPNWSRGSGDINRMFIPLSI